MQGHGFVLGTGPQEVAARGYGKPRAITHKLHTCLEGRS